MSDKRRRPTSGEPFQPSARQFGMFIDAANRVDELQRITDEQAGRDVSPNVVLVRNGTGDRQRFEVLELGDPVFDPGDPARQNRALQTPTFHGHAPGVFGARWGVLSRPVTAGRIAPLVIAGGTWVRLFVTCEFESCRFARPDGTDRLMLVQEGTAYVVWREGGLGEQWAYVRLGNPPTVDCETECSGSGSGDSGSGDSGSGDSGSGDSGSADLSGDDDSGSGGDGDISGSGGSGSGDGGSGSGDSGSGDGGSGDSGDSGGSGDGSGDGSGGSGDGDSGGSGSGSGDGCDGFVCSVACQDDGSGGSQLVGHKFTFHEAAALIVTQAEDDPDLAQRLAAAIGPWL